MAQNRRDTGQKMGVNYALAKWPRAEASSSERYHRRRSTDNYLIKSPALLPNWGHFVCLPACTPGPVHVTRTKRAAAACRRIKEAGRVRHAGQRGTIFMGQSFPNRQQGGRVLRRLRVRGRQPFTFLCKSRGQGGRRGGGGVGQSDGLDGGGVADSFHSALTFLPACSLASPTFGSDFSFLLARAFGLIDSISDSLSEEGGGGGGELGRR